MLDIEQREMLALLEPMQVSPEEKELRAWIKRCKAILAGRDVYEVASMAITCGFDRLTVYSVLSCFTDAMDGTHVEKRAAFQTWRLDQAIKEVHEMKRIKELDLRPLWASVHNYQAEGL